MFLLQLGENQSLKKADEWRRLLTVTPVVLWLAWKDENDDIPDTAPAVSPNENITTTHSRKRRSLYDAILLLCAGVRLLSTKVITMAQANAGQMYLANYCQRMLLLGVSLTINHHIAMHFSAMVKLFGPVYAWWLFAFERFNGMLEKVNHNGHDGGRVELTLLRSWVQSHLVYELLLALPSDASQHERNLIHRIINTDASRGGMMTQIAIFQSEAAADSVSLPKRLPKTIDLHSIVIPDSTETDTSLYLLLLRHCQRIWPDLHLQPELSDVGGMAFMGSRVARRLPYVRKHGLRYGSISNPRTKADTFVFILQNGLRVPAQIVDLFAIAIPGGDKPVHVCAIVRKLRSPVSPPLLPWDL